MEIPFVHGCFLDFLLLLLMNTEWWLGATAVAVAAPYRQIIGYQDDFIDSQIKFRSSL